VELTIVKLVCLNSESKCKILGIYFLDSHVLNKMEGQMF